MRRKNNRGIINGRVDRLSSLPNDILIGIISLLPLQLAFTTGTLSRRWRGLWTNTTAIDITYRGSDNLRKFDTGLNETVMQITINSFINSFSIEFAGCFSIDFRMPSIDTLIRRICDRNVHQLKVTWPHKRGRHRYRLPSVVFKMQSLVSLELGSTYCHSWQFPYPGSTSINLPNLKRLTLHCHWQLQWIEKLTKACPSLDELSLDCTSTGICESLPSFKCSNQKLRQLTIILPLFRSCTIVIDAPNLEYLAISVPKCVTFSFEEEPILLRETKIEFAHLHQPQSDKLDKLSKLYGAISNVSFLTLDISAVDTLCMVFRNVTCLTFNMKLSHNLTTLLSVLEMCPVVDVLTLKFGCVHNDEEQSLYVSTLGRTLEGIKSINVEIENWKAYCKPVKSFIRLIVVLLRIAGNLEHFNLRVNQNDYQDEPWSVVMVNHEHELKLCKVLYRCPMASACCDVEFNGRFLKMSRKAGPRAWTKNGKVIRFYRSRKGFIGKNNARYIS